MKFPIAVVVTMISLVGMSAVEIDFNDGWEWRYGGEKEWRAVDLPHDFMIESPWDESAESNLSMYG